MRNNKNQIMERLKEWEINYKDQDRKNVNDQNIKLIKLNIKENNKEI